MVIGWGIIKMKYIKKPVIIEAIQWKGNNEEELLDFFGEFDNHKLENDGTITIGTLEGNHTTNKGDWIIKGVKGEFYPCKPDIFKKTYEKII